MQIVRVAGCSGSPRRRHRHAHRLRCHAPWRCGKWCPTVATAESRVQHLLRGRWPGHDSRVGHDTMVPCSVVGLRLIIRRGPKCRSSDLIRLVPPILGIFVAEVVETAPRPFNLRSQVHVITWVLVPKALRLPQRLLLSNLSLLLRHRWWSRPCRGEGVSEPIHAFSVVVAHLISALLHLESAILATLRNQFQCRCISPDAATNGPENPKDDDDGEQSDQRLYDQRPPLFGHLLGPFYECVRLLGALPLA
mmetsp:Transcript_59470/g.154551  ORF Transcript_59470/g.154551 Transcript_59470/m.154551 type:complete len:250 (-) Transcript_59470:32-781(-)